MGNNSGGYSKFQERLKRIVRNRIKRKKKRNQEELQEQFIIDKVNEIRGNLAQDPIIRRNPNVKNIHKKTGFFTSGFVFVNFRKHSRLRLQLHFQQFPHILLCFLEKVLQILLWKSFLSLKEVLHNDLIHHDIP